MLLTPMLDYDANYDDTDAGDVGVDVHAKPSGLDDRFTEQKQRRPCQGRGDSVHQQVAPPPPTPKGARRRFGCRHFNRQSAQI